MALYHVPVLYQESLDALAIKPNGVYVDCTFGGGGHSRGILERLGAEGKLIAFDQDADAQANVPNDDRLLFVPQNFKHLQRFLRLHGYTAVDGILADLGVSSHQFDEGERGFSIRFDGPLDMRMDQREGLTAADVIATYTAQQLHKMFEQYGEVTNSKTLANHIVQSRQATSFNTIESFKAFLQPVIKGNPNKYLAQVFQALRIEVNDELGALRQMLEQSAQVLQPGGRLAVITFHSLEDRMVKLFMKHGTLAPEDNSNPFSTEVKAKVFEVITKKPIEASAAELKQNNRARSARLRIAVKQ